MMKLPVDNLPPPSDKPSTSLLAGVRVLDLTTSIAGPYATQLLADFGAEVIKVERPGSGDDTRAWGPPFLHDQSLWYLSVNRNKQSVTLDYSTPERPRRSSARAPMASMSDTSASTSEAAA